MSHIVRLAPHSKKLKRVGLFIVSRYNIQQSSQPATANKHIGMDNDKVKLGGLAIIKNMLIQKIFYCKNIVYGVKNIDFFFKTIKLIF